MLLPGYGHIPVSHLSPLTVFGLVTFPYQLYQDIVDQSRILLLQLAL